MNISELVKQIQYVLAPAVMISSAALLLLGFQNKLAALASRFRALNQEKRVLSIKNSADKLEVLRLENIKRQIDHLMSRVALLKTAILYCFYGILAFLATSVIIFLDVFTPISMIGLGVVVFLMGLLCIFYSVLCLIEEIRLYYRVLRIEYKSV